MTTQPSLASREASLVKRSQSRKTVVGKRDFCLNRGRSILAAFHMSHFMVFLFVLAAGLSLNLDLPLAASFGLADRVVEQKLANGLTVLMVERHQTPVVSLNMTFGE